MSSQAYIQKITRIEMTHQEIDWAKVTCDQCGSEVYRKQIQCHQGTAKCKDLQKQYTPTLTVATIPATIPTTTPEPEIDQQNQIFTTSV
jgi:hypothetical protein